MVSLLDAVTSAVRTERGQTISGTRITLYDLMDYSNYPAEFVGGLFDLSVEQVRVARSYIEENWAEVEAEYRQVLQESESLRLYYEAENRERVEQIAKMPAPIGREAAWEKLQLAKARF